MKINRQSVHVVIGNKDVRPSLVRVEQYAAALPACEIVLSGEHRQSVTAEESVTVYLNRQIIFTGRVLSSGAIPGGRSYKCGYTLSDITANCRKEKISYIFEDLASQAGLKNRYADIPDVELPHFHCSGNGWKNLLAFADLLSDWSEDTYDIYIDVFGSLQLRPARTPQSFSIEFKRGKNALLITHNIIKAFPLPLSYGGAIKVNGQIKRIVGLRYVISPQNSLMELMV